MCYNTATPNSAELRRYLKELLIKDYHIDNEFEEHFNADGFARPFLPTVLSEAQDIIKLSQWKLIPHWVKTEAEAKKYPNTLNAEGESIFEKASYRSYILKRRGILWVKGFYEPHKVPGVKETENYFCYKEGGMIPIGIVYAPWTDQDTGEIKNTFSVITTKANPQFEVIHNEKKRMPLILEPKDFDQWFNARERGDVEELIKPWEGELNAHQVVRITAMRNIDTNYADIQNPIGKRWVHEEGLKDNRSLF